jgi:hypothetical protein
MFQATVLEAGLRFLRFVPLTGGGSPGALLALPAGLSCRRTEGIPNMPSKGEHDRRNRYGWVAALPAQTLRELAALAERSERLEFDDPIFGTTRCCEHGAFEFSLTPVRNAPFPSHMSSGRAFTQVRTIPLTWGVLYSGIRRRPDALVLRRRLSSDRQSSSVAHLLRNLGDGREVLLYVHSPD